eukprot:GILI01017527.1.p1 GENE.GILI01017527.1~~GILI01017527.1.p1  ORF type:complete len:391 (-),score=62.50 GILI01017527.1:151-1323(-)
MAKKSKKSTHEEPTQSTEPTSQPAEPPADSSKTRSAKKRSTMSSASEGANTNSAVFRPEGENAAETSAPTSKRLSRSSKSEPIAKETDEAPDPLASTTGSTVANPTIPSNAQRAAAIQQAVNDINLDDICFKIVLIGDSGVGKSAVTFRFCDDIFFEEGVPTLGVDFKYTRIETAEKVPRTARLQVWDTAGQETFLTLTTGFYRSAAGVVLCFDLTNRLSFLHLDLWMQRVKDNCLRGSSDSKLPPIILVGCKLDLAKNDPFTITIGANNTSGGTSSVFENNKSSKLKRELQEASSGSFCHRQVTEAEALAWCEANNVLCYFETSAKENTAVIEAFRHITTHIVQHTKMDSVAKGSSGAKGSGGGVNLRPKAAQSTNNGEKEPKPKKSCC